MAQKRHTGDEGAVAVEAGGLQSGEGGRGRGFVVAVSVVIIVRREVGGAVEHGANTGSGGREGDEGAVQRG